MLGSHLSAGLPSAGHEAGPKDQQDRALPSASEQGPVVVVVVGGEAGSWIWYNGRYKRQRARQGPLGSPTRPQFLKLPLTLTGETPSQKEPTQATLSLLAGFFPAASLGRMKKAGWGVGGSVSIYRMYSHL